MTTVVSSPVFRSSGADDGAGLYSRIDAGDQVHLLERDLGSLVLGVGGGELLVAHVLDSVGGDIAAEVLQLTGGAGADLVLESAGGVTFGASLAAAKRVTGRVVVYGVAGGEAPVTNWELVHKHQVHVIGFNVGVLVQAAPQIFGAVMGELSALIAAGVLGPGLPTVCELADGPIALTELETRATVGKLALMP